MKISLTFEELNQIVKSKSEKDITLSYVDDKTIRCTYKTTISLGFVKMPVSKSIDINIRSIVNNTITLGFTDNIILAILSDRITRHLDLTEFGVKIGDGEIRIELAQIKGANKVLDYATINNIIANEEGVTIEATHKI